MAPETAISSHRATAPPGTGFRTPLAEKVFLDRYALSERGRRDYEAALEAFLGGRWSNAGRLLARLPDDGAAAFLTSFMERHHRIPPRGWNGVMALENK